MAVTIASEVPTASSKELKVLPKEVSGVTLNPSATVSIVISEAYVVENVLDLSNVAGLSVKTNKNVIEYINTTTSTLSNITIKFVAIAW